MLVPAFDILRQENRHSFVSCSQHRTLALVWRNWAFEVLPAIKTFKVIKNSKMEGCFNNCVYDFVHVLRQDGLLWGCFTFSKDCIGAQDQFYRILYKYVLCVYRHELVSKLATSYITWPCASL